MMSLREPSGGQISELYPAVAYQVVLELMTQARLLSFKNNLGLYGEIYLRIL